MPNNATRPVALLLEILYRGTSCSLLKIRGTFSSKPVQCIFLQPLHILLDER